MSYSANTTVRQLLMDEQAKGVLEKHLPGATSHPQLPMAMDMSLREVSWYPESGLTQDKLNAMIADLEAL